MGGCACGRKGRGRAVPRNPTTMRPIGGDARLTRMDIRELKVQHTSSKAPQADSYDNKETLGEKVEKSSPVKDKRRISRATIRAAPSLMH